MSYLLAITLLLAPTYAVRFATFGFPTNLLMVWVVLVWIVFAWWLAARSKAGDFVQFLRSLDKKIFILALAVFLAGTLSVFIGGFDQKKAGQFIILFLQPITLFFIFSYLGTVFPSQKKWFVRTAYVLLGLMGIYSIIQYFTLVGLPPKYWGNGQEPKRSIGFFSHPNFYALFSAPLLAFLIADLASKIKDKRWAWVVFWLLGVAGLILSLSRAGWIGFIAAMGAYFLFAADKKIKLYIALIAIIAAIAVASVPNFRWRVITPFRGETSANSRITLWKAGWTAVKSSPVTGLGLLGFGKEYRNLVPDNNLNTHNYPHNIFLDLWVETGIIGLISLIGLMGLYIYRGLLYAMQSIVRRGQAEGLRYSLGAALFLIVLVFQGLIDNPYFKNDLAIVFWLTLSLIPFHNDRHETI